MKSSRDELACKLGISSHVVTDALLTRITDDGFFLHHLQLCKDDPQLLEILLQEARTLPLDPSRISAAPERATGELIAQAGAALVRWVASGLKRVSEDDYERRMETCRACQHLSLPPRTTLYQLVGMSQQEKTLCGLCGCDVRRKARLATENCPDGRWV